MTLLLRETDVQALVTMADALAALEFAFAEWAAGRADNQPRRRVQEGGVSLAVMSAALPARGLIGFKAYTAGRAGTRFWVHLYDAADGRPRAVIEADQLGRLRTGAASGIATRYLALPDAGVLTLFGAGTQALTQALAVTAVRAIQVIRVVSRNPARRRAFTAELRKAWPDGTIEEASTAEAAVEGAHVVSTITPAGAPIVRGAWLAPGQHLNICGSNRPDRREVDAQTIARAQQLVADDVAAARVEAGDLLMAESEGLLDWRSVTSLKEVVAGRVRRSSAQDISVFKSVGLALEDIALAATVLERAEQQGAGEQMP